MIRTTLRFWAWVVLGCVVVCAPAFAQNDRASITGRVTDPSGASVSGAANSRHVVLVVWDGMRPDFISEQNTPTLAGLARHGVTFRNHHSVYLSSTEVNGTAISTGSYPARSGLVGKYIMTHLAAPIQSLFDEPTESYLGITAGQLICQDDYRKDGRGSAFGSYQWLIANSTKPNDIIGLANAKPGIFGPALHSFLKDAAQHYAGMVAVIEDLPVKTNQVRLGSAKDKFGIPLAEVTHTVDDRSLALKEHVVEEGKKILKAAKPRDVWASGFGTMHCMGGTVMGKNAADSVVNSYGQSHEIANLYIAGAGLFPTSAGVNPTFTISAVSTRGAEHLAANWSDHV